MNGEQDRGDDMLDVLFAQATDDLPVLSSTLTSRIEADARAVQPVLSTSTQTAPSFWRSLLSELGGWPSLGSLATATVAGLYLGFVSPDVVMVSESGETDFLAQQDDILDGYLDGGEYFFEEI